MFTENIRECCSLTQILVKLERRNNQNNYHISDCFFYNSNNAHYTLRSLAMPLCGCVLTLVCMCVSVCMYDVPVVRGGCENRGSDRAIG